MLSFLVFITAFSARAQTRTVKDWSVADYFESLPEKYKTFGGDFLPPSKETTVMDEQNGYVAYMDSPSGSNFEPFPIFEMALFKSQTKPALLVAPVAKAKEMYHPETFGRTGTDFVKVE